MNSLDYEAEWCKSQLEDMKKYKDSNPRTCDCWIVCTEECEKRRKELEVPSVG